MARKSFINVKFDIKFNICYKVIQTEGFLAYEYNPFRNLRISSDRYKKDEDGRYLINNNDSYEPVILKVLELKKCERLSGEDIYNVEFKEYSTYITDYNIDTKYIISNNNSNIPSNIITYSESTTQINNSINYFTPREIFKSNPINTSGDTISINSENGKFIIENYKNELIDFTDKNLNFDINHPIDIEIQESYDGSVNLILNDDLNPPKLINSRFTPLENGLYKIVDRSGNNDTNIYDELSLKGETNLYKTINQIPILTFNGIQSGGELSVGNYVFYFKYVDSDGNETDFVAESGIVSVFIGDLDDAKTIKGAISDTNSHKLVKFILTNIDTSYDYINVYYTRSTGTINGTEITRAYKLDDKFVVTNSSCNITIIGLEPVTEISLTDINIAFNIIEKAKTQAQVQNRLFLGNVNKTTIPYEELSDLSLRITPVLYREDDIGSVDEDYNLLGKTNETKGEYYNPYNIYYRLGYWEDIYRFGIVYILNDYTLSPVFNIRGIDFHRYENNKDLFIGDSNKDSDNGLEIYKIYNMNPNTGDITRNYIEIDEDGFINKDNVILGNAKGVIRIRDGNNTSGIINEFHPIGIKFKFQEHNSNDNYDIDLIEELQKYTKGFFFVRQKRIPTVYCQGLTIGYDPLSKLPIIPINESHHSITESFISNDNGKSILDNEYNNRVVMTTDALPYASIIPEAEINSGLYSQIFNGSKFTIREPLIYVNDNNKYFVQTNEERHYYINFYKERESKNPDIIKNVSLTYIDDNIQLKTSGTTDFSSRAGEAEVAYKYKFFGKEDVEKDAKNLLRGCWGSYVGTEGIGEFCKLYDVLIPGYDENLMSDYFKSRFSNSSSYYSISDRIGWENLNNNYLVCYRGDCYYGNFTHRMLRNFQDPESPTNDTIVDPNTWENNFSGTSTGALDYEKCELINRGDVNAIQLGHWVTFKCMSNINLALRCEDDSNSSEVVLNGHPRTFYPISRLNASGEYKIPESNVFNAGLNSTTSDKYHFVLPNVPYIKNEFSNRIMYSDIYISDAYKNSYRVFQLSNYRDYNSEYGFITKIVEWYGNLIVVFERGVGLISVNERVQTGSGDGGQVYLNTMNVLPERPLLLSKLYGSQWEDSIIRTDNFVYGVDTIAKKIWRTNGRTFEIISDFKIQQYLNDNISLTEREKTPTLGLRNVKSHYNKFKYDVLFTFYDDVNITNVLGEIVKTKEWNLCYNERLQLWITRYSWIPLMSENISNVFFTSNKEDAKNITKIASTWKESTISSGIVLDRILINDISQSLLNNNNLENPNNYPMVLYPGVEIPNLRELNIISKDIIIGKLDINLDLDSSKFKVKYCKYTFENSDIYPDNEDFKLIEDIEYDGENIKNITTYLILKTSDSNIKHKYTITDSNNIPIYATLSIRAELIRKRSESINDNPGDLNVDVSNRYSDIIYIRTFTENYDNKTYFWRHGVAGIFDNDEDLYPTSWYKLRENNKPISYDSFEFEFIVNKNIGYHKVFKNLLIISNNVMPDYIAFEVIGDSYEFNKYKEDTFNYQKSQFNIDSIDNNSKVIEFIPNLIDLKWSNIKSLEDLYKEDPLNGTIIFKDERLNEYSICNIQQIKNINNVGIIKGNSRYQEDFVNITINPIRYKILTKNDNNIKYGRVEETRPRDKFIRIRVKYKGDKKVIITTLQTLFDISFS